MLFGWYSNCEKHGSTNSRTDSCYSTATRSLEPRWFRLKGTWEASQLARPFAVRGRTVLRSAGWEVADDLLDHVIILNERHLKRLMSSYVLYYHEDRTHLGLAKDTPAGQPTAIRSERENKIQSFPRLGGLHHRYAVAA